MKKILVTGSAGFIGSALALNLLNRGDEVIGIDNHNNYYDAKLKESRLERIINHASYSHFRINLEDRKKIKNLFKVNQFHTVINLAAQAGVRYSIENPTAYIKSNLVGFANILEESAQNNVKHLIYASSSSVYGLNHTLPFSIKDNVDNPASLYAATKKSNELMAHSYSNIYGLPTTGLRYFTVYGPWGRPDMALFKFTKSILEDKKIEIFNYGNHTRDFTYIDDVVEATVCVIDRHKKDMLVKQEMLHLGAENFVPWEIFNIGNNKPIKLMEYVSVLEKVLGKKAKIELLPFQKGDILDTSADMSEFEEKFNFTTKTHIEKGITAYVKWFKNYYQVK